MRKLNTLTSKLKRLKNKFSISTSKFVHRLNKKIITKQYIYVL